MTKEDILKLMGKDTPLEDMAARIAEASAAELKGFIPKPSTSARAVLSLILLPRQVLSWRSFTLPWTISLMKHLRIRPSAPT